MNRFVLISEEFLIATAAAVAGMGAGLGLAYIFHFFI